MQSSFWGVYGASVPFDDYHHLTYYLVPIENYSYIQRVQATQYGTVSLRVFSSRAPIAEGTPAGISTRALWPIRDLRFSKHSAPPWTWLLKLG